MRQWWWGSGVGAAPNHRVYIDSVMSNDSRALPILDDSQLQQSSTSQHKPQTPSLVNLHPHSFDSFHSTRGHSTTFSSPMISVLCPPLHRIPFVAISSDRVMSKANGSSILPSSLIVHCVIRVCSPSVIIMTSTNAPRLNSVRPNN